MAQGLRELIGRAMVDQEFLADLQREPDVVLADFQLDPEERTTVLSALARLAAAPSGQRAVALRNALLRRVST
jgi:hypothetical protein